MDQPVVPPELYSLTLMLADPRQGSTHPLYIALGVLFGVLLVASIAAYTFAPRLVHRHRLRTRLLRRLAAAIGTVSALGVFWVVARLVGLPLFARPIWLWFTFIALVAVIGYAVYYWRHRYPGEFSAYEETLRRRRWMPTPRKRAAARRR